MRKLLLLVLFLMLVSCEKDKLPEVDQTILETEIDFFAREIHENNEQSSPVLSLDFKTTKIYPCYNYYINFKHSFENEILTVEFKSIGQPEICLTAFGPATGSLKLPLSTRQLKLVRGNTTDLYEVNITTETVAFEIIDSSFSNLIFDKTFRLPENSFAVVCGTNLEDTGLCDEFLNVLSDIPSLSAFSFEGEGRIPYPDSSSGHWNNTESKYFLYENDSDFIRVGELLEEFTAEYIEPNQGNSIAIFSWDNRKFYSWISNN
ncbi:hypothetical protein [Gramella sp. AN32]|uniref:Lipoprotein n=1 Tax=Christiangramia antarctica TaxID=2058158 RepID=A0ABW5X8V7_9FLAO|nr:hypothetical protein [Gramella sp. AN32]MCM4156020.1 hypothetical protein [Gramella sp. AN32]